MGWKANPDGPKRFRGDPVIPGRIIQRTFPGVCCSSVIFLVFFSISVVNKGFRDLIV